MTQPNDVDQQQLRAVIKRLQSVRAPCFLCNQDTFNVGVFFPNDSESFGIGKPAQGKHRAAAYRICRSCLRIPDYIKRVEKQMKDEYAAGTYDACMASDILL